MSLTTWILISSEGQERCAYFHVAFVSSRLVVKDIFMADFVENLQFVPGSKDICRYIRLLESILVLNHCCVVYKDRLVET